MIGSCLTDQSGLSDDGGQYANRKPASCPVILPPPVRSRHGASTRVTEVYSSGLVSIRLRTRCLECLDAMWSA